MKSTTMFKPRSTRKLLESLLEESLRTHDALDAAQEAVDEAANELSAFRADNPGLGTALSWTPEGRKRDQLESSFRAAVRRRDQCRGSNDLASRYRIRIEQELRRS